MLKFINFDTVVRRPGVHPQPHTAAGPRHGGEVCGGLYVALWGLGKWMGPLFCGYYRAPGGPQEAREPQSPATAERVPICIKHMISMSQLAF